MSDLFFSELNRAVSRAEKRMPKLGVTSEGEHYGTYQGHPNDPRNGGDGRSEWVECETCKGDRDFNASEGGCPDCDGEGGTCGDRCISKSKWEDEQDELRAQWEQGR